MQSALALSRLTWAGGKLRICRSLDQHHRRDWAGKEAHFFNDWHLLGARIDLLAGDTSEAAKACCVNFSLQDQASFALRSLEIFVARRYLAKGKQEPFVPRGGEITDAGQNAVDPACRQYSELVFLYTDAIVSPGGTGLLYTGASARLSFALARNGYIPGAFARLTSRGTPLFAIAFSFLCGLVILLPFPGWQQLVGFISAAAVLTYAMAPLALGALRRQDPTRPRLFRLPAASLVAPAAFAVASEIVLFTGWAVVWKLIVAILIGFALLTLSTLTDTNERSLSLDWHSAVWLWPYLLGIGAISYLSSFDTNTPSSIPLLGLHGPRNVLTFGWDILAVAVLSLAVYALAIRTRLPDERALENVGDLAAEAEAEDAEIRAL